MLRAGEAPFEVVSGARGEAREQLRRAVDTGQPITLPEARLRTADGSEVVLMRSFIPVTDASGEVVGAIETLRDLSAESRVHARYKELIEREKARAEELERQVEDRTRQLTAALEEVTRLSRVDSLTRTLNRRAFFEHADQGLRMAHRHGRSAALLMCDLDHFKHVNDTHGHQAGDVILARVAAALEQSLRKTDKIGRFGGEEFVVLLTETDATSVMQVAERCLDAVRAIPVSELIPGASGPQTVSLGAAVFPDHGDDLERLLQRADEALYRAKRAGRDRAVLHADEPEGEPPPPAADDRSRLLVVGAGRERVDAYVRALGDRYEVEVAASAAEGLVLARERQLGAIVAEETLPDGSGLEFLRETLAVAPEAVRILALTTRDVVLAVRGIDSAHVDELVIGDDDAAGISGAIEQGRLRRELVRENLLRLPDAISCVHAGHLAALDEVLTSEAVRLELRPLAYATGELLGYEAVTRVDHPLFDGPESLFTAAARLGSVWELGRVIRKKLARAVADVPQGALLFAALHPAEVSDPELVSGHGELARHADQIVFEITQRASIRDSSWFRTAVDGVRGRGFRLAIGELGSGTASLVSVANLSPAFVKIDGELVRGLDSSGPRRNLVRSIVRYCDEEGILAVAEGVETEAEARAVRELGCHILQGDFLGPPREP